MFRPDPRQYTQYYQGDPDAGYPHPSDAAPPPSSIAKTILTMGVSMVAFHTLNRAFAGGMLRASVGATRFLSRVARRAGGNVGRSFWAARAAAARGRGLETAGSYFTSKLTGRPLPRLIPTLLRMPQAGRALDPIRQAMAGPRAAYRDYLSHSRRMAAGADTNLTASIERLKSFWAGKGLSGEHTLTQRLVGSSAEYMKRYIGIMPGWYMADRALNILHKQDTPHARWYNPIGVGLEMARFATGFLPIDIAFRGAAQGLGMARAGTIMGLSNLLTKPKATHFIGKSFGHVQTAQKAISDFAGGLGGAWKQWSETVSRIRPFFSTKHPMGAPSEGDITDFARKEATKIKMGFLAGRDMAKRLRKVQHAYPLENAFLKPLITVHQKLMKISPAAAQAVLDSPSFRGMLATESARFKIAPKPGLLAKILNLEPARLTGGRDVGGDRSAWVFARKVFPKSNQQRELLARHLEGSFLGPNVYMRRGSSDIVDLRKLSPSVILKNIITKASAWGVRVPLLGGEKLKPFQILRVPFDIARAPGFRYEQPPMFVFGQDKGYYVGKVSPARSDYAAFGVFTPHEGEYGMYMHGKFHSLRPSGGEWTVEPVETGYKYHFFPSGESGWGRKLLQRYLLPEGGAHVPDQLRAIGTGPDEVPMGGWKNFLHTQLLRPLQIGAGYGQHVSLGMRIKNFFGKFYKATSPIVMFDKKKGVFNDSMLAVLAEHPVDDAIKAEVRSAISLATNETLKDASYRATQILLRDSTVKRMARRHALRVGGNRVSLIDALNNEANTINMAGRLAKDADVFTPPKIRNILAQIDMTGPGSLSDTVSTYIGRNQINQMDELKRYISMAHLQQMVGTRQNLDVLEAISNEMFAAREITETQRHLIRGTGILAGIQHKMARTRLGKMSADELANIAKIFVEDRKHSVSTMDVLAKTLTPTFPNWSPMRNPQDMGTNTFGFGRAPMISVVSGGVKGVQANFFPEWGRGQPLTANAMLPWHLIERPARLSEWFGLGFDPRRNRNFKEQAYSWMKLTGIGIASYNAWQMFDAVTDTNPLFAGTMLTEGINVALAEQYVKGNIAVKRLYDAFGVTKTSKYLEGLMPGFVESPLMKGLRGIGAPWVGGRLGLAAGGPLGGLVGAAAGTALSATYGFGFTDLTTTAQEQMDIYSGRTMVPERRGRYWEFGRCLSALSLVQLNSCLKQAKDVVVGDRLLTASGNYKQVLSVAARKVRPKEKVYRIATSLCREPSEVTQGHPLLLYGKTTRKLSWFPAGSIRKGHWLAYPKPKVGGILAAIRVGNSVLPLTKELAFILGLFLAEGNTFKATTNEIHYVTEFAFNQNEKELAEQLCNAVEKVFGKKVKPALRSQKQKGCTVLHKCLRVRICSKNITSFFRTLMYQNEDKLFPAVLMKAPIEFIRELVYAYWLGDGHTDKRYNKQMYITSSRLQPLIMCQRFLLSQDIACHVRPRQDKLNGKTFKAYRLSWYQPDWEGIPRTNPNNIRFIDNYVVAKVVIKEQIDYDEIVYDFEIEDDHTFCGLGFILHNSPFMGGRIMGWGPSWFARMKAQPLATPTMYGSKTEYAKHKLNPLGVMFDPYHWERRHYLDRPYPITGGLWDEVPFVGPILSSTMTRIIKPRQYMHRAEAARSFTPEPLIHPGDRSDNPAYRAPKVFGQDVGDMGPLTPGGLGLRYPPPVSPFEAKSVARRQIYQTAIEFPGIYGFLFQSMVGGKPPFHSDTEMASSNEMTSFRRWYWDHNLGGLMEMTELFRRFVPRPLTDYDKWNPLSNRQPHWLPGPESNYWLNFQHGDPYIKIPKGEERLPGPGYESLHDVKFNFPASASILGKTTDQMVKRLLKLESPMEASEERVTKAGTAMHKSVQDLLARQNLLVEAEATAFDPWNKISGSIDAVVRKGRQKTLLEIKTVSAETLGQMAAPQWSHISQLNAYLHMSGVRQGQILYIARDDPTMTKSFEVMYNPVRYRMDLSKLNKAREQAYNLLMEGIGYSGEAYSYLDRLAVLGDVAPYSDEYKKMLSRVNTLDRLGLLSQEEHNKKIQIRKMRKAVVRQYELFPYRFRSKVLTPDTEYNLQSENDEIKAAAEYPLPARAIGGLWETVSHSQNPIFQKFLPYQSPLEHYKRFQLYGKRMAMWDQPVRDFIKPYMTSAASPTAPLEGAASGAVGGFVLGGGPGMVLGASTGMVYGAVHGAFREITGTTYLPKDVIGKRDIQDYFDKIKYMKNRRLYQITGNPDYQQRMTETMMGVNPNSMSRQGWTSIYRSLPYWERGYFDSFMHTQDANEREQILKHVTPSVGEILQVKWGQQEGKRTDRIDSDYQRSLELQDYFRRRRLPPESWMGWHPDVRLDDIKMKTMQKEGMDAHDAGLGWYDQERRIKYSPFTPGPIDMSNPTGENVFPARNIDQAALQMALERTCYSAGLPGTRVSIRVVPGIGKSSRVTLHLKKRNPEVDQVVAQGMQNMVAYNV